jgi:GAF domain-containing protein
MKSDELTILNTQDFLKGGGETGRLIRSYDWSATPLGPVKNWPSSLKTCIRIILTSRQPMFVWWGPQLINIYNDAYIDIVKGKHPHALGQPASEVWKEIWDQVGPRAETAMRKNEGTYDEALLLIMERNGYPEETYYTFSYSPIPGENGGAEGIICANTDDTQRIIGERQLRTLKDLGKNIIDCKTNREVYNKTIEVLRENPQDFPFAVLYELRNGTTFHLAGKTSSELTAPIAAEEITINSPKTIWPLKYVAESNKLQIINNDIGPGTQLPKGAWMQPPEKSLIIPIAQSGQKMPYAILIVGLNRYRLIDEKYTGFFQLIADQIATSLNNIHSYQEEKRRTEALLEIDRAKTTFFSNISHEFRTPLTLMLSPIAEILENKRNLSDRTRENIEIAHRNALRLLKLVNTLLDFSRIEAGKMQATYERTDITMFTKDLASTFRSAIERSGIEYIVDCETIQEPVYVDPTMWEKIVFNLLSNAFKYTIKGKIEIKLLQVEDTVQ